MGQQFKSIYFADYPAESARERNLTLAFSGKDDVLYEGIKSLTSHEIRERLGHANHRSLTEAAQRESLPLNTYCLRLLRDAQAQPPAKTNGELFRRNGTARPLIGETKSKNDITRETPASFEPTIDYVVTKIPRFAFEKFPQAKHPGKIVGTQRSRSFVAAMPG